MSPAPSSDLVQQDDLSYRVNIGGATVECSFVGTYDHCVEELTSEFHSGERQGEATSNKYIRNMLSQFGINASGSAYDGFKLEDLQNWYCSSMSVTRMPGGMANLHVVATGARTVVTIGLEFQTLSRPILGYVFPEESVDNAIRRVSKLEQWKNMKDTNHLAEYLRFQYKVSSTSKESTDKSYYLQSSDGGRTIARKIKKGIDSFDRYLPIITITLSSRRIPTESNFGKRWTRLSMVGTQGSIDVSGWGGIDDSVLSDTIQEVTDTLKKNFNFDTGSASLTWMITGDTLSVNEELVYTRSIQYMGVSSADIDLYPDRADFN